MADTTKSSAAAATTPPKKSALRSPKYPSLTFKDAVDKAKLIYKQERRAATTANVIYTHLGFKKKTGPAGRALSALRQYGLVEEKNGNFAISDRAFRYFNLPEDSPEREVIERELAMKPRLFREIVAKYSDGLPSDVTLKSYLVLEKDFNENSTEQFIKGLKASIEIAKPFEGGYTPSADTEDEEEDEDLEGMDTLTEQEQGKQKTVTLQPIPKGQLPFPLYLSQSQKAMLYVPASLTRKEYDLLKKQIENSFLVMEATILSEDSEE